MKASICTQYGPPSVLTVKTVDKPVPKDHEVLIRVYATTVNRTDCAILRAKPFIMRFFMGLFKPNKSILGTDFAGQIEAVGKDVVSFKAGDKVFGFNDQGLSSHAEYMTLPGNGPLTTIPENTTYEQAAASTEGAHYAFNMINKVGVQIGQKVLVNGATGAIGSAAVQMLVQYGADVTAVCSTKNLGLMTSLGATRVIDYSKEDFTKEKMHYNYIFDTVGKSSFFKCKPQLQEGGVYMSSELGWMAQNIFLALLSPVLGKKKVVFPVPSDVKRSLGLVKDLLEKGKFIPVIDRKYPLAQIVEAYSYVETGQKTGNVVLTMGDGAAH